jgi:N-acetylglucosamine-6-sulfatase
MSHFLASPPKQARRMRLYSALLLLLASTTPSAAAPNIVVIMTDDQEDTGSMAYMPKLHALLAEQGVTFTNSFVDLSLCAPSRASFLTGQAAHNTGIKANSPLDAGGWESFKPREDNDLPVWLQKAGYKTALIGKYLNRYGQQSTLGAWLAWLGGYLDIDFKGVNIGNPRDWVPPGWDLWYAFTGSRVRYYDYEINENGTILTFDHHPADYSTDVLKDRAVRFIADQAKSAAPFFMLVTPKAPHAEGKRALPSPNYAQSFKDVRLPAQAEAGDKDASHKSTKGPGVQKHDLDDLRASYRAELQSLQSVDDLVAAVVDALKTAGKLDDTVIIYTSDNGFLFGDHRLTGKSAAYEGSIKVPLVIKGPDIPAGTTRDQLVNNLDVAATVVALAGAEPGVAGDGRSLVPLFANASAPWRSALLIQGPVSRFDRKDRFVGLRTATRKYVVYEGGYEQLFDLEADPGERKNAATEASYADELAAFHKLQATLKSCAGASCWIP